MSSPMDDLDKINNAAHAERRRGKATKPKLVVAPEPEVEPELDVRDYEAAAGALLGLSAEPDNNNNNNNSTVNTQINTEVTMTQNAAPVSAPAAPPNKGKAVNVFDTALAGLDWFAARLGEVAVPAGAGAGAGYGIVHFAGDKIPAQYRIPVMVGCAVLFTGGKLLVQKVVADRVRANGQVPAANRWTAEKVARYVDVCRKAGVPEEAILKDLRGQGVPVVEAQVTAPVTEVKKAANG